MVKSRCPKHGVRKVRRYDYMKGKDILVCPFCSSTENCDTDDVVQPKFKSKVKTCPKCSGSGFGYSAHDCIECGGSGEIVVNRGEIE